jgi:glutathione S-transferase
MTELVLLIGNKNYSSWSLRPWLALRAAGLPFREHRVPLDRPESKAELLRFSPAGKAPALRHGDLVIWDSLAICEYAAELAPDAELWPRDAAWRARARAVACEMHSGFLPLRMTMQMNVRGRARQPVVPTPDAAADVARIEAIFEDCRAHAAPSGPFLFGRFGIADCMYAPVATRFRTYGVRLSPRPQAYVDTLLAHPAFLEWEAEALREPERMEGTDALLG